MITKTLEALKPFVTNNMANDPIKINNNTRNAGRMITKFIKKGQYSL